MRYYASPMSWDDEKGYGSMLEDLLLLQIIKS